MRKTDFKSWLKDNGMALPVLFEDDPVAYTFAPQTVTLTPELLHQLDRVRLLQDAADDHNCPDRQALESEIEQAHRFVSWTLQGIVFPNQSERG
ncbi:hypothetical protein ACOI8A_27480 [Pseudomonas sp. P4795]|uniref:hypothetical protein n=1 Tax=Pseudomonas sp. P4795 TaxID=3409915 RepID=UPI003B5BA26C